MKTIIEAVSGQIVVQSFIHPASPACNSLHISSGPFIFPISYPRVRKELIAALLEADAELDAAEAKKEALS